MSTKLSQERNTSFNPSLASNMSHFANDRVSIKFKNSVLFYSKKVLLYGTVNSF